MAQNIETITAFAKDLKKGDIILGGDCGTVRLEVTSEPNTYNGKTHFRVPALGSVEFDSHRIFSVEREVTDIYVVGTVITADNGRNIYVKVQKGRDAEAWRQLRVGSTELINLYSWHDEEFEKAISRGRFQMSVVAKPGPRPGGTVSF